MKLWRTLLSFVLALAILAALPALVDARPAAARGMKVLLYPGQVRRESLPIEQAMAFKVPKALRFKVSALKTSGGKLAMKGTLTNPTARALRVVVFPVSNAYPFYLELTRDKHVRLAPPKGPPVPPVPPAPIAFVVPARTRILFGHAIDLRDYRYTGRPTVMLRWRFHFWNGPKPKGSLRVKLPAHPSNAAAQGSPQGSASASLPPYPAKWITKARLDNRFTCGALVYKRGCALLRHGEMIFRITLTASGAVVSLKRLSTTIRVDPALVARCIVKTVRTWTFHPPTNVARTFTMRFVLSDKC